MINLMGSNTLSTCMLEYVYVSEAVLQAMWLKTKTEMQFSEN